jgi:hypothetical protein
VFKQELDRQIPAFERKAGGNRDNIHRLRRVLVKAFLNELSKGVTPGNIVASFEATGVVPFSPEVLLSSQFLVDPVDSVLLHVVRTGAEVNKMVLTFPEGLGFLCLHEFGRAMQDADHDISYQRIWGHLKMNSADDERALSNSPSMFVRMDGAIFWQVNLQELPAST